MTKLAFINNVPREIVLDLPPPISTNRLWRANKAGKKRITASPQYESWKVSADNLSMALGQFRGLRMIHGLFEITIIVKRNKLDLDNQHKGLLDWLQSRGVIENDKYCEDLHLKWGDAPTGCRVIVRACE